MKAIEIIQRVDELEPNQYNIGQKLSWLAQLDGQIFRELTAAYEPQAVEPGEYSGGEETLLVPPPYAEGVYCRYLQAMMAAGNFETAKYNQQIAMYDSAYGQYRDWVLRSRKHRDMGRGFVF